VQDEIGSDSTLGHFARNLRPGSRLQDQRDGII
jgi:hypothetical protein